jgi:hypothetical protein
MRKNTMASLLFAAALGLPLIACEDTKARGLFVPQRDHGIHFRRTPGGNIRRQERHND